mgnify:FL=1|tara:strand:+ start:278 stop:421 length:144 start_codon:yes stop_codon:yes gene_type:complete
MTNKDKLDKFIENAAMKVEAAALEDMIKKNKNNLKLGTIENYKLFDR